MPARSRPATSWARATSRVQTAAASPKGVALARRMSSSRSENFSTESTGPKISSRAIAISSLTFVNTVGSMKKPVSPTRLPPVAQVAPSRFPASM